MRVEFRGFGRNWQTLLLALVVAVLLSGVLTVLSPRVGGRANGEGTVAAAVYPCQPHSTYYRWVTNNHDGGLAPFALTVKALIAYNGCDVYVVSGTQRCSWWAIGYGVQTQWCGNYRLYTYSAYGQVLTVGATFYVSIGWSGFPIGSQIHLCQWFNRNGTLFNTKNGPYGEGC